MNKQRRKQVEEALELMRAAQAILEPVADEEREAYDNMPEGLQQGERGELCNAWAEALDEVNANLENDISTLESME